MSNALYITSLGQCCRFDGHSTLALQELIKTPEITLFAVGLCVLAVWVFRRVVTPAKLTLRNAPSSALCVEPGILFLLTMAVFYLQAGIRMLTVQLLGGVFPEKSPELLAIPALIAGLTTIVALFILAPYVFRLGIRRGLGLNFRHWIFDSARGLIAYLAVIPICLILLWLFTPFMPEDDRTHSMLKALNDASPGIKALLIFASVVLAPISEELLFRGFMQSALRKLTGNAWLGIAITSVLFALVHTPLYHTMPSLFVLAVVMGYNYERCGRLWPAILIHMIFNGVSVAGYLGVISLGS